MSKLWHIATKDEIEDNLNTDFERGMTNEFAQSRLKQRLKGSKKKFKTAPKTALSYFSSVMAILLVILSVVFMFSGKAVLGTTVVILVLISEIFGFAQDIVSHNAELKIEKILRPSVTVIRDGEERIIFKDEIAEGDIVVLSKGDVVPCDGRITCCENLKVDQSCITGEAEEVIKTESAELDEQTEIKDQSNMLFAGSVVVSGNCRIVACQIGENTVLSTINGGTLKETQKSYMQKKLCEVSKVLSIFTVVLLALLLTVSIISGADATATVLLCLALGAVLVPSKLPVVISCAISKGMLKMAQSGNVVKDKATLEKLALCDVIITGKTGIITENEANAFGVITTDGICKLEDNALSLAQKSILKIIFEFASVCSQLPKEQNIPEEQIIDTAVLQAAQRLGADTKEVEIAKRCPLDMNSKSTTVYAGVQNGYRIITKGDVKEVISNCTHAVFGADLNEITEDIKNDLLEQYTKVSQSGFKAVAVAYKDIEQLPEEDEKVTDLVFLGIIVIENKIRQESQDAVKELILSGVRPVMLTYDNAELSEYIARQSGILTESGTVITGDILFDMSDEELDEKIDNIDVFAQLKQGDKTRVLESLKRKGKTVCMLSASSYDKDALKTADVYVSQKDGAEVNELHSDVVTNGTLLGLVNVMKQAQTLYLDARKSIRFMVSGSASEMMFILFAMLLTSKLPLSGVQVLLIGILTTGILPFMLPFGLGWDKHKVKTVKQNNSIFLKMWPRIICTGILVAVLALVVFVRTKYFVSAQSDIESYIKAQTTVFAFFVLYALFGIIYLRKNVFANKENKKEILTVLGLVAIFIVTFVLLINADGLKNLFGFLNINLFSVMIYAIIPFVLKILEDVLKKVLSKAKMTEAKNGTDI